MKKSNTKFGFSILRSHHNLRMRFFEGGKRGRISFIQACIASGMVWDHRILQEAKSIFCCHVANDIAADLWEGEGIYWGRNRCGELYVL